MKKTLLTASLALCLVGCANTKASEHVTIKPAKTLYENTALAITSGHDNEDNDVITFENRSSYNMQIKVTQKKRRYSSSERKFKTYYEVREKMDVDKYKEMHLRFTTEAHGKYRIVVNNKDKGNRVDAFTIKYKE